MSFTDLRRRVSSALSVENRVHLNALISARIATDAFEFLDGSSVTFARRVKILKCSILDLIKTTNIPTNVVHHLMEVVFDFISHTNPIHETTKPLAQVVVLDKTINRTKVTQTKQPKTKVTKKTSHKPESSDVMQVDQIPNVPEEVLNEPGVNIPPPREDHTAKHKQKHHNQESVIEAPPMSLNVSQTENDVDIEIQKKRKFSDVRSDSPLSPTSPQNASWHAKRQSICEEVHGSAQGAKDPNFAMLRHAYVSIGLQEYNSWLDYPPSSIGFNCKCKKMNECKSCILAVLSTPLTLCKVVKCKRKDHQSGLGPHTIAELDISLLHGSITKEIIQDMVKSMFDQKLNPSVIYGMLHQVDSRRPLSTRRIYDELVKLTDFIFLKK